MKEQTQERMLSLFVEEYPDSTDHQRYIFLVGLERLISASMEDESYAGPVPVTSIEATG